MSPLQFASILHVQHDQLLAVLVTGWLISQNHNKIYIHTMQSSFSCFSEPNGNPITPVILNLYALRPIMHIDMCRSNNY